MFIGYEGMVWYFIWPAPHPKYVHPPGTTTHFFHLRVNPEFRQNFNIPFLAPQAKIFQKMTSPIQETFFQDTLRPYTLSTNFCSLENLLF